MVEEEKREKRISDRLASQFEATLAGQEPRGTNINNWAGIAKKCFALAKVYVSPDPVRQVLECEANQPVESDVPWQHRLSPKGYMHTRASRNAHILRATACLARGEAKKTQPEVLLFEVVREVRAQDKPSAVESRWWLAAGQRSAS